MNTDKTQVVLFHRQKNKMVVTDFVHVPNEGDILRFNNDFYKVEKVVYSFAHNEPKDKDDNDYPSCLEPQIFIVDASNKEVEKYDSGSKSDWNRNDWIGHFKD